METSAFSWISSSHFLECVRKKREKITWKYTVHVVWVKYKFFACFTSLLSSSSEKVSKWKWSEIFLYGWTILDTYATYECTWNGHTRTHKNYTFVCYTLSLTVKKTCLECRIFCVWKVKKVEHRNFFVHTWYPFFSESS